MFVFYPQSSYLVVNQILRSSSFMLGCSTKHLVLLNSSTKFLLVTAAHDASSTPVAARLLGIALIRKQRLRDNLGILDEKLVEHAQHFNPETIMLVSDAQNLVEQLLEYLASLLVCFRPFQGCHILGLWERGKVNLFEFLT